MCASGFASTWHYPHPYRVGLESITTTCRLYSLKLQHPWLRSNIPYTTLELPDEVRCLESTDSAPNKEPHLKLINPLCLSPL